MVRAMFGGITMRYSLIALSFLLASCTTSNIYSNPSEKLSIGMSKADAEKVLGSPTAASVKDYGQCVQYRPARGVGSLYVKYENDSITAYGGRACYIRNN